ncbi:hypothetical protein OC845_001265 [Tilletia horrida]|nr:hypothetical protein OC845_001265 [Tilletia horrida]
MATGEKATLRLPAPFDHARLDLYPYFPAVVATSGLSLSEIDRPLPFLLWIHDGILPFHTGCRIDAPPQVVAWCKSRGIPLLCLDYTLLSTPSSPSSSSAGSGYTLEDTWASVEACWRFINGLSASPSQADTQSEFEETLKWQITATGHGAEADTGTIPLMDDWREFQPRGIDGRAGMIWGTGAGGFLASLAAARLHPPPVAVVLERPLLDLNVPIPPLPKLPEVITKPPMFPYDRFPSFPGISDRLWYEDVDANNEEHWRKSNDMDIRRPLPGERDSCQSLRMAIDAYEKGRTRASTLAGAFSNGKLPTTSAAAISNGTKVNQPFPPTFIVTSNAGDAVSAARTFLDAVRSTSPEGAIIDKLSAPPTSKMSAKAVVAPPQRYLHLGLDDQAQSVPLLDGRTFMTDLPLPIFGFLSHHLADALHLRASQEGVDGSGVVEELRKQAHQILGQAKL